MIQVLPLAVAQVTPSVMVVADDSVGAPVYKPFSRGTKRQLAVAGSIVKYIHESNRDVRADDNAWMKHMVSLENLPEEDAHVLGFGEVKGYDRLCDPDEDPNLCNEFWATYGAEQNGMPDFSNWSFHHQVR